MNELKGILPAANNIKGFEKIVKSDNQYIILLESRLSQITGLVKYAKKEKKKVIIHVDLVQGLKADEYGMEFLIHEAKIDGIISTRGNVISIAKKSNLLTIQRLFALDSHALDHNLKMIKNINPDYIEVLPGLMPKILQEIHNITHIPVIAGGLIREKEDIINALNGGAVAVTTTRHELWDL